MRRNRTRLSLGVVLLIVSALVLPRSAEAGEPAEGPVQQVIVQVEDGRDAPLVAEAAGAVPVTGTSVDEAPVVGLEVDAAGLRTLRADPRVESVMTRGTRVELAMAQSVTKVGAGGRHAAGFDGDGEVVAVIDTGVGATFGGSLVGQACFAATQVGTALIGHCGTGADQEFAFDQACSAAGVCDGGDPFDPQAARPCSGAPTSCEHGTAVAAVAARHEIPRGVAPDAGVYAVQVFNPTGTSADLVDVYLALDHIVAMSDAGAFHVAAVNLSVATSATFVGDCLATMGPDGSAFDFIFNELRHRGIAPVVSSGNDGKTSEIAFPACLPSAISVGSTDLDDDLASFGNRGPGLDLLAPGADEASFGVAIDPMEIPGNSVVAWAGTSFSAPHVAGAYALLDQEYPDASVEQRSWFLQTAGVPVSEGGRTYRRLMLRPPEDVLLAQRLFPGEARVAGSARAALGDVDGDGRTDVLAHGPGNLPDRIAYGGPGWGFETAAFIANASYLPVIANITGAADGPDDIIWYGASAPDFVWVGDADRDLASVPAALTGTWTPSVGDFDGDGWDDVLWYGLGSAADLLWYGGASGPQAVAVDLPGVYTVGVGDFDGEGHDDLLLDGFGTATDAVWRGGARGSFTKSSLPMDGLANLVVANLDGDADDDVVVYRPGAAADQIWLGGPTVGSSTTGAGGFSSTPIAINTTYAPVAGDLDGDGDDEILWFAAGPTADPIWFGQPTGLPSARSVNVAGSYQPMIGDVDGQAGEDIVWIRSSSVNVPIWWSYGGP